jgi:hypothetical protein
MEREVSERVTLRTSSRLRLRRDAASALLPAPTVESSAAPETALIRPDGGQHAAAEATQPADGEGSTQSECLISTDVGPTDRQAPGLGAGHVSHVAQEAEDTSQTDIQSVLADASLGGSAQLATTGGHVSDSIGAVGRPRDGSAAARAEQQEDAMETADAVADGDLHADPR